MGQKTERVAYCPISQSLDVYGDKWSLLIIREMMLFKRNTYGDFLKMEEKIATNILADRLVNLEQAGIITKQVNAGSKSKFLYHLTAKGIDLAPVIVELFSWGEKYYTVHPQLNELRAEIKKDKTGFKNKLTKELAKIDTNPV